MTTATAVEAVRIALTAHGQRDSFGIAVHAPEELADDAAVKPILDDLKTLQGLYGNVTLATACWSSSMTKT